MRLEDLHDPSAAQALAQACHALMAELMPLPRSMTGDGVRATLDAVACWAPLQRHEVPSGTQVLDWQVPLEWNIRDAYLRLAGTPPGPRLIDWRVNTLHVVSGSVPVHGTFSREALEPHLHSLPAQPDAIPYRTRHHAPGWGLCLAHRQREQLGEGPFEVCIDSTLAPGHLSWGECVVPGRSDDEALVYTHVCHPQLANDNLSGIAVVAALARALRAQAQPPRLTWRFVFAPGTIGSITWLAQQRERLPRLRAGLVVGLLGGPGPLTYKRSRRGDTLADRAAETVLPRWGASFRDFEPYGYDERQFCSPGFNLPVGRLTRSPNGEFPQYHTSADDLDFVTVPALAESLSALAALVAAVDANTRWLNLSPYGEPQLGRRGLYAAMGGAGAGPGQAEHALLWLLNQSDGTQDLLAIAQKSGLPPALLAQGAQALVQAGLLMETDDAAARRAEPLTQEQRTFA